MGADSPRPPVMASDPVHKELLPITGSANRLLRMLGEDEYRALIPKLRRVRLAARQLVGQPGAAADSVYFPCGCVLSVLTMMADGTMVETGTVGREGFAGADVLLGGERWNDTVVCQVAG